MDLLWSVLQLDFIWSQSYIKIKLNWYIYVFKEEFKENFIFIGESIEQYYSLNKLYYK